MSAKQRSRRMGDYPYRDTKLVETGYDLDPNTGIKTTRPTSTVTIAAQVGEQKQLDDVVTPDFRKIQAEGGFVSNPMSKWHYRISTNQGGSMTARAPYLTDGRGERYRQYDGDLYGRFSAGIPKPADDSKIISDLLGLASTSAHAGVEQPAVQGQVFVSEFLKTLKMIARPASGLRDYILDSRKWKRQRNIAGGKAWEARKRTTLESSAEGAAAAAASWNEARFGWRPFLLEMEAILETLCKANFAPRKTSRASQRRQVVATTTSPCSFGNYTANLVRSTTSVYEVRCGMVYDFQNTPASDFGFRWADIPSTLYELLPYSFVVDWFLNLGDYIQALVPKPSSRILTSYSTVHVTHTVVDQLKDINIGLAYWSVQSASPGTRTAIYETWRRVPNVPPPSLVWENDLSVALRSGRGWDALALVTQLVVGAKGRNAKKQIGKITDLRNHGYTE